MKKDKKNGCATAAPIGVGVMLISVAVIYNILHYAIENAQDIKEAVRK